MQLRHVQRGLWPARENCNRNVEEKEAYVINVMVENWERRIMKK